MLFLLYIKHWTIDKRLLLITIVLYFIIISSSNVENERDAGDNDKIEPTKPKQEKKKKEKRVAVKKAVRTYDHPWAMSCLKGHSANILDMSFSQDGNHVVTCDDG